MACPILPLNCWRRPVIEYCFCYFLSADRFHMITSERTMGDIVGKMTERLLVDAGIGPGMRVLDVGCGRGESRDWLENKDRS
jgi:cyclopropane fatty-acyl-phospholipid synthase-like methyltransferase